ncbi:MAG TPA: FAD-dependent oxidoreductase [Acidimicrobiales bacterium]|jgi:glycine/D-amino acid oxidase-like deaminating enzyme
MDETYDVVVIGAGLAGLTAAATAAGQGCSVLVLDRQAPGGRASTDEVGRFRFNRGAHALYRRTPARAILEGLGVRVATHAPLLKGAQGRLGDRVGVLPVGPPTLARTPLLGIREKAKAARFLAGAPRWRPDELSGMTVSEWFDDQGLDGRLRQLVEMLTRLTSYVVDFDRVSADVVASQMQMGLAESVDYLSDGWASLVDGLADAACRQGAQIDPPPARADAVVPEGTRVRVEVGPGERTLSARSVVLASGPPEVNAGLLPEPPPEWSRLGPALRTACLGLGLASPPPMGYLLGIDRPLYLAQHGPPGRMAPPGGAVVETMLYLGFDDDPTPEEARVALTDHARAAGIDPEEAEESRYLHRMVTCGASPTPETGGMQGRPSVGTGLEGVFVAGDWVGPTGHIADAAVLSGDAAGRAAAGETRHGQVAHLRA